MISPSEILQGKILIVDDQETNVLLLERMLRSAGYVSISSTRDSNEVCDLHSKNCYDLILLDLEMPSMAFSGFQVMDRLKEIEPGGHLPVIVITAHPDHKLHALRAGARDFISKPFEFDEALARIRNMLEIRLLHTKLGNDIKTLKERVKDLESDRDRILRQRDELKLYCEQTLPTDKRGGSASPQPLMPPESKSRTLLYIENKPDSLKLVEKIIARYPDFRLLSAVNGKSGIELACASLPDVILTDINLPDISGFKVLEVLRSDPATAHIPVIAISSNTMPLSIEKGLEAGFFRYLTKPIRVDEFMVALNVAFDLDPKSPPPHDPN